MPMAAELGSLPHGRSFSIQVAIGSEISHDDQAVLIELCSRAFADDFSRLFIRRPNARHVVVRHGTLIAGHGCWESRQVRIGDDMRMVAWISAIAVLPEMERRGIGTLVLSTLERDCSRMGVGLLSAAEPVFYSRLGWGEWNGTIERPDASESEPVMFKVFGVTTLTGRESLVVQPRSRQALNRSTAC